MKNITILDFGTSKIKALTFDSKNLRDTLTKSEFINVSIGKILENSNLPCNERKEIIQDFVFKSTEVIMRYLNSGFRIKVVATEIFRKSLELKTALIQTAQKFGIKVEILTPQREGELLAANFELDSSDLLLDMGGGSVNTIYTIDSKIYTNRYALGSYVLYNLFQHEADTLNNLMYTEMDSYIKRVLHKDINVYSRKFNRIILGSNQMLSFFSEFSEKTGLNFMKNTYFEPIVLDSIINDFFLNKNYKELLIYFEKNPSFIYGADKMLLVLKNFVELSKIKMICPTDKSISSGLANIILNSNGHNM